MIPNSAILFGCFLFILSVSIISSYMSKACFTFCGGRLYSCIRILYNFSLIATTTIFKSTIFTSISRLHLWQYNGKLTRVVDSKTLARVRPWQTGKRIHRDCSFGYDIIHLIIFINPLLCILRPAFLIDCVLLVQCFDYISTESTHRIISPIRLS